MRYGSPRILPDGLDMKAATPCRLQLIVGPSYSGTSYGYMEAVWTDIISILARHIRLLNDKREKSHVNMDYVLKSNSKEFAQIELSTPEGGGFTSDLWLRQRKF